MGVPFSNMIDIVYCHEEEFAKDLFKLLVDNGYTVCLSSSVIETGTHGQQCVKRLDVMSKNEVTTVIKWRDLPNFGDHMTIQDFKDCVASGGFIPDDGTGRYATADKQSDVYVDFDEDEIDKHIEAGIFTHVMWFNK